MEIAFNPKIGTNMTTEQIEAMKAIQDTYLEMKIIPSEELEAIEELEEGSGWKYGERGVGSRDQEEWAREKTAGEDDEESPRYASKYTPKYAPKVSSTVQIFHKVPFAKKDEAKGEGMRWNADVKKWYHSDINKSNASSFVKEDLDEEVETIEETTLTPTDIKQRESIVKGMKKKMPELKAKYGDRAQTVMYATATNIAKNQPD